MIWNPLDWTAGPFLALYLSVAVIVCLLDFRFRSMIGPAAQATHQLSALELAYLAGGAPRLGDAVLLQLTSASWRQHRLHEHRSLSLTRRRWRPSWVGRLCSHSSMA